MSEYCSVHGECIVICKECANDRVATLEAEVRQLLIYLSDAKIEIENLKKSQPCPTCIARRGIDTCRPDEEFHVTHYDADEMHMDPLPDKPCECGAEDRPKEEEL